MSKSYFSSNETRGYSGVYRCFIVGGVWFPDDKEELYSTSAGFPFGYGKGNGVGSGQPEHISLSRNSLTGII